MFEANTDYKPENNHDESASKFVTTLL